MRCFDAAGNPSTGHYGVFFDQDVSECAVTATAEPVYSAELTASINGTFRGFPNPLYPPNMFMIVLSDQDGHRVDARFNVIVACGS